MAAGTPNRWHVAPGRLCMGVQSRKNRRRRAQPEEKCGVNECIPIPFDGQQGVIIWVVWDDPVAAE